MEVGNPQAHTPGLRSAPTPQAGQPRPKGGLSPTAAGHLVAVAVHLPVGCPHWQVPPQPPGQGRVQGGRLAAQGCRKGAAWPDPFTKSPHYGTFLRGRHKCGLQPGGCFRNTDSGFKVHKGKQRNGHRPRAGVCEPSIGPTLTTAHSAPGVPQAGGERVRGWGPGDKMPHHSLLGPGLLYVMELGSWAGVPVGRSTPAQGRY